VKTSRAYTYPYYTDSIWIVPAAWGVVDSRTQSTGNTSPVIPRIYSDNTPERGTVYKIDPLE
jgi:hypothetical protein